MKQSPENQNLEELLRSSRLALGGFMGGDTRSVFDVIDADAATLSRMGSSIEHVAERMQQITKTATQGLGTWVRVDDRLEAKIDEVKGSLTCPWPHPGRFANRITTVRAAGTDRLIRWSDLNTHLIVRHGFFEGKGSSFRIEPEDLSGMIFRGDMPADFVGD